MTKDEALARAEELADGNEIDHGWKSVPHDARPYLQSHGGPLSHRQLADLSHGAPVEQVRLSKLVATQDDVGLKEVERYVEDPDAKAKKGIINATSGALVDMPIVVDWHGKQYIHDGHHRLFAQRLMGAKEAGARVIDADAVALGRWAEEHGHLEESDEHAEAPEAD